MKELRISIDLDATYKIILNCFKEEAGYASIISINSGVLKFNFNAVVGGFLKLNFEILLREKLMSNDGQLTLNFNRIEQQQSQAIRILTEKCNNLEQLLSLQREEFTKELHKMMSIIDNCQIFASNIYTPQGNWCDLSSQTKLVDISTKELTIDTGIHCVYRNIKVFYQLEKIIFHGFTNQANLNQFSNTNVSELVLNCGGNGTFTDILGIDNFPNLTILTITVAPGLRNVVKVLSEVKHNIKTIKFQGCSAVNVVELQTYCQVNGIFLAIS
ncbi:hypothetical protein EBU24_04640 [bacterium]|nr:hypothetical protein [bacterium]